MVAGKDTMAQAVYLAQLEAVRGNCKCNACKILRKASRMMTQEFLNPQGIVPPGAEGAAELAKQAGVETLTLDEEEE